MFVPDPLHNHTVLDERIFVFGSNEIGIHGGGAAWYAHKKLGAVWTVGEGLTGKTYALPTCSAPGKPIPFSLLELYVGRFILFAESHPELRFFVSAVGCGIAGFNETDVAYLFKHAPENCDLPPKWYQLMNDWL
jgi:hypothetical protein